MWTGNLAEPSTHSNECANKPPKCPIKFCKLTIDTTLKSSDGELFGAHQRNLETYSDSEEFPIDGSATTSDPVCLEETADVVLLMLQFMHQIRQPTLDNISFSLLASLADAAEKYRIYSAMGVCKIKMMLAMCDYPNEVFLYSAKHNYPDLADMVAKSTFKNSSSEFLARIREAGLHDDIAFRWLRYRDRWMEVFVQLVLTEPKYNSILHEGGWPSCSEWPPFQFKVIRDVSQDLAALDGPLFWETVEVHKGELECHICLLRSERWVMLVRDKIGKIPKYSQV